MSSYSILYLISLYDFVQINRDKTKLCTKLYKVQSKVEQGEGYSLNSSSYQSAESKGRDPNCQRM